MELAAPPRALPSLPHSRLFSPASSLLVLSRPFPVLSSLTSLGFRSKHVMGCSGAGWPRASALPDEAPSTAVSEDLGVGEPPEDIYGIGSSSLGAALIEEEGDSYPPAEEQSLAGGHSNRLVVENDVVLENVADDQVPKKIEIEATLEVEFKKEDPSFPDTGQQSSLVDILNKFDVELDLEDTPTILIYGVAALVALRVSFAIIYAVDSLPLVPKILEVVGLGFVVWFSFRNLIFKESRDGFFAKFDDLKKQIIG